MVKLKIKVQCLLRDEKVEAQNLQTTPRSHLQKPGMQQKKALEQPQKIAPSAVCASLHYPVRYSVQSILRQVRYRTSDHP